MNRLVYFTAGLFATLLTLAVWANLSAQPRPSPVTASKPSR